MYLKLRSRNGRTLQISAPLLAYTRTLCLYGEPRELIGSVMHSCWIARCVIQNIQVAQSFNHQ